MSDDPDPFEDQEMGRRKTVGDQTGGDQKGSAKPPKQGKARPPAQPKPGGAPKPAKGGGS